MPTPRRHTEVFPVEPGDIDELGHVNNLVYLRWVQDVAIAHWRSAARAQDQAGIVWVVVHHEIDYVKPALAGETVVARTWVERWGAATSERHTEFRRGSDDEVLARARTVWCAVDPVSRRPMRITEDTRSPFLEES